jgi:putative acetyltransferase
MLAFAEDEREAVSTLAVNLLLSGTDPQTFSLLAEADADALGHIAFSPVTAPDYRHWQGYIIAPLAVKPRYQGRHIGSELIQSGIRTLLQRGANTVLVYGDPHYYGRFGFKSETALRYTPPYPLKYPQGWLALDLLGDTLVKAPAKLRFVQSLMKQELW